ncbi:MULTISPECIES: DUF3156 family protein [Pseudomonas]|uniref:DUF3156 family protein n=1 Tax=Pseudomonas TaxID=286 RepID=UPI001BE86118|nr:MULTISPECIES: DUF3156 family protein [Pseudomonas]MBT2339919.1 DUF3156 family protein [Pseudomonas fluorescens]MCD4530434.1 DUF3156 family protein [Pseudomonas sp. C3-2018]
MSQGNLSMRLMTVLQKLSELFSARRAPAGYRPGVTLEHLRRNLGLARFESSAPALATVVTDDGGLQLEIVERTESQLLMHLVLTEFVLHVPASTQGTARLELHHGGAIRRSGIHCRQRSGDTPLATRLQAAVEQDPGLYQALMPLDFKRLRIDLQGQQWCVRLEHMGGSEVVNRMPAFRRYIPLDREQRAALLTTLSGLQRVLGNL